MSLSILTSAQPDSDRLARHHQGASWGPACRHRASDQGHDHAIHQQGELPHPGRYPRQHRPGQLGRPQAGQRRGPPG